VHHHVPQSQCRLKRDPPLVITMEA
jgi:hypothetical protein